MNKHLHTLVAAAAVALIAVNGWAAKIGVVDMNTLIKAHPKTASNEAVLEQQTAEFEAEHEQMMSHLRELRAEFETLREDTQNKALNEAAREAKYAEAEAKLEAMRAYEQEIRENMALRQKQITSQKLRMHRHVLDAINERVGAYAREQGFDLVLDSSGRGMSAAESVVYAAEKMDITQPVLKQIQAARADTGE